MGPAVCFWSINVFRGVGRLERCAQAICIHGVYAASAGEIDPVAVRMRGKV